MAVVQQKAYITIHDKNTFQSTFTDHPKNIGLGILQPTVCRITEVLNGTYELYLEHPIIDGDPRASYIKIDNIIRADGQLFRIKEVNIKLTQNGSKSVTAKALHIWYDLGDRYIKDYNVDGYAPYWFVQNMFNSNPPVIEAEDLELGNMTVYNFSGSTDMGGGDNLLGYAHYKYTNPVACFIGTESSFVSIYQSEHNGVMTTPELHRDNFSFSVNWRKQNAVDNAFNIVHKIDMTDITENIDLSNLITRLRAYDNYGHFEEFKIPVNDIIASGGWLPAHHRTKGVEFQYNSGENNQYIEYRFHQDAKRYFQAVSTVKLSYQCNYAELSNTELYKDYIAAKHCNVGDTGTIVCEALGITATDMEVVKKVKDVIKGETVSLEFGSKAASLTDPKFMSQTINNSKFQISEALPIGDIPTSS